MPRPRGKPQDGELSPERLAFCEGILAGKGLRVAYEEAGFKAKGRDAHTNARQLLREPEVQYYLAVRRLELREPTGIEDERVVREMALIAFFDPAELVAETIEKPEDIAKLPEHVRRLIVGWKYDRHGNLELHLADKLKALDMLARYLGIYQSERRNEADEAANLLRTAFWRYVVARHLHEGLSIAEARGYAERNPEEVQAWARSVGLLRPGQTGGA